MIRIKRTYDPPARADGRRVLVERLWPRGLKKEAVAADAWLKEVAPSTPLRQWFGHRPERWEEFRRRYRAELDASPSAWGAVLDADRGGTVTLLYSARDPEHNSAVVLREYLAERRGTRRGARRQAPDRPASRSAPVTRARRSLRSDRSASR